MKSFILIISLIITFSSFAYDTSATLQISNGDTAWIEGETKKVKLTVWPIEEVDIEYLKKNIEGKSFIDYFFLSKVHRAEFSKNNPTALEVEANLTLKKYFQRDRVLLWKYKALVIPVSIHGFNVKEDPNKIKEFIVLDANKVSLGDSSKIYLWVFVITLLIVLVALPFIRKIIRKKKLEAKEIEERERWKRIFLSAESREDFENLYLNKEKWTSAFGGMNPEFERLIKEINTYQYIREWDEEVRSKIDFIYSEIKDSLND